MIHLTYLFHGNLQYAEFPTGAESAIVERSYLPTLEYFAGNPHLSAVFEYSGVSLELMAGRWPRTVDLLRLMLARGQIELLGGAFANPILPLIPTDHARRHLATFLEIYDALFGDLRPRRPAGLFLQEFAYDPALAPLLRGFGYRYTILTPELLLRGLREDLNQVLKPPDGERPRIGESARDLLHPIKLLGAQGATINAIPLYRDLIDLLFAYTKGDKKFDEVAAFLQALADAYCTQVPALLLLGPSDAEFVGAYEQLGRDSLQVEALGDLLEKMAALPFVRQDLPSNYLRRHPPQQAAYVPAGTSEPGFNLWATDPDNLRLNALCAEASQKLRLAAALRPDNQLLLSHAWRAMLLAENSDGRGWMPCADRRLACYNQALLAIRLADHLLAGAELDETPPLYSGQPPATALPDDKQRLSLYEE